MNLAIGASAAAAVDREVFTAAAERDAGFCSVRVLTPLHSFEPGGVERVAIRLMQALQLAGAEARLVFGRDHGAMQAEFGTLEYDTLGTAPPGVAHWETLWMIVRLPSVIRRYRPDVLFCAGNTYTIIGVMMRLILGTECPRLIAKVSNDFLRRDLGPFKRWLYHRWLRLQARWIDSFIALSPTMGEEIRRFMNIDSDRIDIVPDPVLARDELVDLARTTIDRLTAGRGTRFLMVGRLVKQKNVRLALTAFAAIKGPYDQLVIVGDGPQRRRLRRMSVRLGVDQQVVFVGHSDEVPRLLASSDVFVLSSDYEGLPAVVVEALAAGLPIVATDCTSSMRDLLGNERFGIIVPCRQPHELGRAMRLAAGQMFDKFGARRAAAQFDLHEGCSTYLEILKRRTLSAPMGLRTQAYHERASARVSSA